MASDCDETSCMKKREDVTRPRRHGNSGNIVKGGETKKYSEKEGEKKSERAEISGTTDVRRLSCRRTLHHLQISQYTLADREAEERRTSRAHLTVVLVSLS